MYLLLFVLFAGAAGAQSRPADPPADERLAALIAEALERNPRVSASLANYRAALQRAPRVAALPDPMVTFTGFARSVETRVGPQNFALSIQQRFPWFGKLGAHEQVAAKEAAAAAALYEAERAEAALRVETAYRELAYVDRAARIMREEAELLSHYEALARALYAQGVGPQAAAVKLQAEITRTESRLEALTRQRVDAEAALNRVRHRPAPAPVAEVPLHPPPRFAADPERLYALARERRPELLAAFLRIETEEKRVDAARREGWPDVTLGASLVDVGRRGDPAGLLAPPPDNGKNAYSVTVGMNLPIFRRKYRAGVLEASERFLASREMYAGMEREVEEAIRALTYGLESTGRQIDLFETTLAPQAGQALASAEAAYSAAEAGALDLLDSERTLFEVRLGLARLQTDYWKMLAELERAVGTGVAREVNP